MSSKMPKLLFQKSRKATTLLLRVADTVIALRSRFPRRIVPLSSTPDFLDRRFEAFVYRGPRHPDIRVDIELVRQWPKLKTGGPIFLTRHPDTRQENWRLSRSGRGFIYASLLKTKKQIAIVSGDFQRARLLICPEREAGGTWHPTDVIYDFLQILLIQYLACAQKGFILHASAVKDTDGRAYVFCGKSGTGKSTMAKLWFRHAPETIALNDDRVVACRKGRRFLVYSSPWHGEFFDYIDGGDQRASVAGVFFLEHASRHRLAPMAWTAAWPQLYAASFPVFWNKALLERTAALSEAFLRSVPSFSLGFARNKSIIPFLRKKFK
jgi:hypothetical protein